MRLIQLMHTEFQINNKLVHKRVLENTENYIEVVEKQHGSRKYHESDLLDLNKCLIDDICRLLRISAYYGMNDAIICLDRIDNAPVIITLIYVGLVYTADCTFFQVI